LAEWQRRLVIRQLYEWLYELEHYPIESTDNGFPIGTLERAIRKGLIRFEDKYLRPYWKAQKKLKRR
jgi:hypothetical protein